LDTSTDESRLFKGHEGNVFGLSYSPDGKILASGGRGDGVRLWDVASGEELAFLETDADTGMNLPVFSPDGKLLAAGGNYGDYNVYLWDLATHTIRATLSAHQDWTFTDFSPDGKLLVSSGVDMETTGGVVRLWDVETGAQMRILGGLCTSGRRC
jgi:WD40 repeat protein